MASTWRSAEGVALDGTKRTENRNFRDGLSNTIMIVEADPERAVIWTKPDDWEYEATAAGLAAGHAHPNGFIVGCGDGSVRTISKAIDPKVFHALLTSRRRRN